MKNPHDVILRPVLTEASYEGIADKRYVFEVHKSANKTEIKQALETVFEGIKVEKVIVRTMLLSGAFCGIAGLLLVGGTNHTLTASLVGGRGFTAVMVSWLAKFNPIWMILTSFLLVFLGRGAGEIATNFSLNQSFGDILSGIILFFIIGSEFFITYKLSFRKTQKKEGRENV